MKEYLFEVCANRQRELHCHESGGANRVELCAIPEGEQPLPTVILSLQEVLQKHKVARYYPSAQR